MNKPLFAPLTEDELDELNDLLLYEVDSDEAMTIDIMDGYLHAIAIGPTTLHSKQWLPQVLGGGSHCLPLPSACWN